MFAQACLLPRHQIFRARPVALSNSPQGARKNLVWGRDYAEAGCGSETATPTSGVTRMRAHEADAEFAKMPI